ncbi:MAG: hypothetical protein CSB44_01235 [Gammaproteobacteria bacterium]|nr:MAG: hypothetical protein CSB44_01235 [Gammaproteobacteria bacterium]
MSDSERLDNLELKVMDLEHGLAELSTVIARQYGDIMKLEQQLELLGKRLEQVQDTGPAPSAEDELPPHY